MRSALLLGVLVCAVLVVFGCASTRHFLDDPTGWTGLAAALGILGAYGLIAAMAFEPTRRISPEILTWARWYGLAAGAVYAAEIALEYAALPTDNAAWGLAEFGAVFVLFAVSGAVVGWRARRIRPAALAGAWTAMVSALIWYAVILAVFYAFRGTARETAVLRAEGDFDDFRRSGLRDFQVFLMGDFLGAGFFHLLLSPVCGAILGSLGGLTAVGARRLTSQD
jgi:hypothetical protein